MSLIAKLALTSFVSGIGLMLASFIVWLFEELFYGDEFWIPILVVGVLLVAIPLIGLLFYGVGYIFIEIWT